ncbi:type III effector protein [Ralstonia sp. R-29]|uniref:type III effector protein n=1 Tax=Ralstonia sp. R-29 TaxID=3404059 RepID=UPI003CEACFE8
MYSSALPSADALIARIDRCIRQAAEAAELVARHEALYAVAQTLKSEILEFASKEPDDEAVMRCVQALHEQVAAFKQMHPVARLPYSPELDTRYPFRDAAAEPIIIHTLSEAGHPAGTSRSYPADAVWPYLQAEAAPDARGALYHRKLLCRPMRFEDLRDAREHALVGERGVFAVRDIAAGECLGVYGGRLMTPATYYTCTEDSFVLSTTADGIESWVDGENILAMANTVFAYTGNEPDRQAEVGYNMEAAVFLAASRCGRRFSIRAFFTTEPVAAGTELRWNYRYPSTLIRQRFGARPAD